MNCDKCIHKAVCYLEPESNCEYAHGTCENCIEFSNYYCVLRGMVVGNKDYCAIWTERK